MKIKCEGRMLSQLASSEQLVIIIIVVINKPFIELNTADVSIFSLNMNIFTVKSQEIKYRLVYMK